jgi:HAD superfamily hydrolase (TIGR01509 family)
MLAGIRLIIYDLDGVIVDTSEAIIISFNTALRDAGAKPQSPEEIRSMIGVPLDEMYRRVLPPWKWGHIERLFTKYREVFNEVSREHARVLDGVEETLTHFEDEGVAQCLATNKSTPEAEKILIHLGLDGFFDLMVGYDDVSNPKPSPEMILLALDGMGAAPGEAVLVEDSPTGLKAGKAAGVHTVAVSTGFTDAASLRSHDPDYLINDIRGLKEIVFV